MHRKANMNPWLVVLGSALALTTSIGVTQSFTFSLFIEPISDEFGWSRALISLGYSAVVLVTAIGSPVVGRLLDRFGVRRVLTVAIPLYALSLGMIGFVPALPVAFIALYAVAGIFGAAHSPLPYVKAVAGWFDARRGLALGISMAGIGLGGMFVPAITALVLEHWGWRAGYFALGTAVVVIALPAVLLLVRENAPAHAPSTKRPDLPGLTMHQAARDSRFWLILGCVFLTAMAINGSAAHAVPVLASHGLTRGAAAAMLPALGLASLLGRLGAGFLLDRVFAPRVAAGAFVIALAGIGLLWGADGKAALLLGMLLLGSALGAEIDLIGFLISRYFGLRKFGELFGYVIGTFSLASALGAALMGVSFDTTQSYGAALGGFAAATLIAAALILRLGPYTYPAVAEK
ncbi:MFS transporter [Actibacterium sp. D379-3]